VADQPNQTAQNTHRAYRCGDVAGAQHGGAQILFWLVIKTDEAYHRQIAPGVIVAVEERQLLRAVGGIISRIQIQGDAAHAMAQALGMALDHAGGQGLAHAIELFGVDGVFEARQRGLRSQIVACERIAA
jgi:hypothetical protein